MLLAGCNDDDDVTPVTTSNTLVLTANTVGLLNYLYLLEQLQAAFFQKVVDAFPDDFTADDRAAFTDLRDHEVIHRETLKYTLDTNAYDVNLGTNALAFKFDSFNLSSRSGAYAAARTLKDLSVAAYNGISRMLLTDAAERVTFQAHLKLLVKMASVESRHAAFVREQLQSNSFAAPDVVDTNGLDGAKTPAEVAPLIAAYLPITLNVAALPFI
ncbi:hypothetical protein GCM10027175_03830 [Hymenobacter latericoloratus]